MRSSTKVPIRRNLNSVVSLFIAGAAFGLTGAASPSLTDQGGSTDNSASAVVGDWRGTSICVVRESACHDEVSLYHFATIADNPHAVSLEANKIVDGKPVTMGTGNCQFDPAKLQIKCPLPSASLIFQISGNEMTGTMTLSNGTVWRKLSLKKVP